MKKELIALNRKAEICGALKELMKRKSIQKITIQELADECDISRYTFYYHFTDIYDCLSWLIQEELRTRGQQLGEEMSWEELVPAFVEHVKENRSIYRHLLNSPRPDLVFNIFRQEVRPLVQLYLSRTLDRRQCRATARYLAFLTDFFTASLGGVVAILLQEDLDAWDKLLTDYLHTLLDDGLENILCRAQERGFCTQAVHTPPQHQQHHPDGWNYLL